MEILAGKLTAILPPRDHHWIALSWWGQLISMAFTESSYERNTAPHVPALRLRDITTLHNIGEWVPSMLNVFLKRGYVP
jgi:hypothetical protein